MINKNVSKGTTIFYAFQDGTGIKEEKVLEIWTKIIKTVRHYHLERSRCFLTKQEAIDCCVQTLEENIRRVKAL